MKTAEEAWANIATGEVQAKIARGIIMILAITGSTAKELGQTLEDLCNGDADNVAYAFSGVADGQTLKRIARILKSLKC